MQAFSHGEFGDELLKGEEFASLLEAKVLAEEYREHYNHERPHGALGYLKPAAELAVWRVPITVEDVATSEEREEELEFTPVFS
jgi:transposase InsO family protein